MSVSIPHTSGIYKIICLPTGKIYVGSADNLDVRWKRHRWQLRRGSHENTYLQHAWNKYGADAFSFEVIELVLSTFRLEREQYWLDVLRPYDRKRGFNISLQAGAPMAGLKHSAESRAKMSQAQTGRKHAESTKRMMSERNKGKVFGVQTEESRRKRAEAGRGRVHSPETIRKMRESARRAQTSACEYIVTTPEGEELTVTNLARFCDQHGLSVSCMYNIVRGDANQHRGWTCRRSP